MFHRDYDIYIVSHSGSHKDPDFSLTGILAVIIAIASRKQYRLTSNQVKKNSAVCGVLFLTSKFNFRR